MLKVFIFTKIAKKRDYVEGTIKKTIDLEKKDNLFS